MICFQGTWEFMSIPLLKDVRGHLHTALDDLESFVYVLWYHALRYRPLTISIAEIQNKLNTVFRTRTLSTDTNRAKGGDGKIAFFRLAYFTPAEICECPFPVAAVYVLEHLRTVFCRYYTAQPEKPTVINGQAEATSDDYIDDYVDELSRWKKSQAAALEKMRHPLTLIEKIFDLALTNKKEDSWPRDDGADDNLTKVPKGVPGAGLKSARSSSRFGGSATSSKRLRDGESERTTGSGAASLNKAPKISRAQSTPRSQPGA
jgi:hypothetical protein